MHPMTPPPAPAPNARLNRIATDLSLVAFENQEGLMNLVGSTAWSLDLGTATLQLGRPFRVACLGSWSQETNRFLWSWANPGFGVPAGHPVVAPVAALRDRAAELDLPELATPEVDAAAVTDLGWLPAAGPVVVAADLLGAHAVYSGPYPGGRVWTALLDAPPVQPDPRAFGRLLATAAATAQASPTPLPPRDRHIVEVYAGRRGLAVSDRADGGLDVAYPGGSRVEVVVDAEGRTADVRSHVEPADVPEPRPFQRG